MATYHELKTQLAATGRNWPTFPVKRKKPGRSKFKLSLTTFARKSPNTGSRKRTFSGAGAVRR
jgi:hypothetical protein